MPEEVYFDLTSAGFVPGYAFSGGPGRVFFDEDTKQFLRIEPLGGSLPIVQEEQRPEPAGVSEPVVETPVETPPTETHPAQESAPVEMPEVTPVAEPIDEQPQMSAPAQEETPVQDTSTIDNGGTLQ